MSELERLARTTKDPLAQALLHSAEGDRAPSNVALSVLGGLGVGAATLTAASTASAATASAASVGMATKGAAGLTGFLRIVCVSAAVSGSVIIGGQQMARHYEPSTRPRAVVVDARPPLVRVSPKSRLVAQSPAQATDRTPVVSPASTARPVASLDGAFLSPTAVASLPITRDSNTSAEPPPTATFPDPETVPENSPKTPVERAQLAEARLAREVALLDRARQALAVGHAREALAALDEYQRAAPNGSLWPESIVLRVQTSLALGDRAAAEQQASTVLRHAPTSRHAERLRQLLGNAPTK